MDFGIATSSGDAVIVSTHTSGPDDTTPLQLISADLLAYYQRLDRAVRMFLTQSQIDAIKGGA